MDVFIYYYTTVIINFKNHFIMYAKLHLQNSYGGNVRAMKLFGM